MEVIKEWDKLSYIIKKIILDKINICSNCIFEL